MVVQGDWRGLDLAIGRKRPRPIVNGQTVTAEVMDGVQSWRKY